MGGASSALHSILVTKDNHNPNPGMFVHTSSDI